MFAIGVVPDKKKMDLVGMEIVHVIDSTLLCYNSGLAVRTRQVDYMPSEYSREKETLNNQLG